ncbi:HNH endonuclease signature motif containing protein [Bradyrhizobium sp. URHD0069]|uniref:HNH endonuclease n=1 Tax=Bradyrhizobium sp. URHD0069 TaxID=1380355 RepID=UPI0004953641|nr:HNH endonuclease signature motif containing protein [Bradyrhizobium sp. URHD0069]
MSWGFERGRVYNRRADIHNRFEGQQQGGIITPKQYPLVLIITGEEGLSHGYADRQRPDGVFEYFGEGQTGNMSLQKGNKAVATHSAEGKSLLLFRKAREGLIFEDEMVYETHHIERAPDSHGNERDAIVFELRPLSAIVETVESTEDDVPATNLDELRRRAYSAAGIFPPERVAGFRNVYLRSEDVRAYVLGRAKGCCEGCKTAAPFFRKDGSPYLEPHHIRRVSDGGPDDPAFVIALCPNCHRRVHAGSDGTSYNAMLLTSMVTIEPKFEDEPVAESA